MTASPASFTWRVEVGADAVTTVYEAAEDARAVFVFAHGAGGRMDDAGMLKLGEAFRAQGLSTVRFNFVYREKGSGRPDAMPRLMECVSAVVARGRDELRPPALVIGGRSMGGRAASMLAADGFACDGLLLLAYPLHPDKQPETLRDAHLPSIHAPVLCFNGTRDALCRRDLMEATLRRVGANWTMHWLEGADHSFHVLKSSGRTDEQVVDEVAGATRGWLAGLG
ncbi:MAG TPA: alpha/beta family hydrolase [Longimicrobium sp.]|nr:alpha/beta family hydrolase [Longimicrobium sp.]